MKSRIALALLIVGLYAPWLSAQVPAGGEFQVNSYTSSYQTAPSVASDAAGNFVVTWVSDGQDGSSLGAFAQRYDASGAVRGAEFRVNSYTLDWQETPRVASDRLGNLLVTWASNLQDGDLFGVFAQRYDSSGTPRGTEFRVNSYTNSTQYEPALACDAGGNCVVVWSSFGQDGNAYGVFARRYDTTGAPRGSEFQVNTYTTSWQAFPAVASDDTGNMVVAWMSDGQDGSGEGVFAQRYDASGVARGAEFRVNTFTVSHQSRPAVASDAVGNHVIAWMSAGGDGSSDAVLAQRYDASGAPLGSEFRVNTYTTSAQRSVSVAADAAGGFVVAWQSTGQDGSLQGIFAQRYDTSGALRGAEFRVNSYTTARQAYPSVGSDRAGNFVVAWMSAGQDGSSYGIFAQRFGGLQPANLAVDASASGGSDGNHVLEPGETLVAVAPSWQNVNGATQTFGGTALSFDGPPAGGVGYELTDASASYGTVANGATALCSDCYQVGVTFGGTRPATHWDATFTERLTPDAMGQTKSWTLHVGESFSDVPKTSGYYRFVETMLHKGVTGGCSATSYCPANPVTREQMSVFVLVGKEGSVYRPAPCGIPLFADVPASSPFCRWIEELAHRGVVAGCGSGMYCPTDPVTREQMSVFLLRTLDPALDPPYCATPVFPDVPASSPFCRWIEELARRGVTSGCGGGNYCPTDPVTREQMAVFISATFGLSLYGP